MFHMQLDKPQPAVSLQPYLDAREDDRYRPQHDKEHTYQCGVLLSKEPRITTKRAKDMMKGPASVSTKHPVVPAKRQRNDMDSHADDASQQAQEQQLMIMRMMNAMIQNEDDEDDQNMLQLQAAMSKLMKTKVRTH